MGRSISVFGLGYVGSVTAACLARQGNAVIGVDLNPAKVEAIEAGRSPVVEPGLGELIADTHAACRLYATLDAESAVLKTEMSFLCVGTPSLRNGKLDLGHVEPVCRQMGEALKKKTSSHLVVLRSTVLPGTAETVVIPALEQASGKRLGKDFGVCVNPEFMREGTALDDYMNPAITVIGCADPAHGARLREIYAWVSGRVFEVSLRSAEMIKYVGNAWHAAKVAFANEAGTLARELGVDTEAVMQIFTADTRLNISSSYLKPGFAFGGSCLPKDLRALQYRARELDLKLPLLESLLPSNDEHLARAAALILETGKKKIAILGLSFKCETDDLRESPQVRLVKRLLGEGLTIQVWDEKVALGQVMGSNRQYIEEVIPHIGSLLSTDLDQVIQDAEVVVIGNGGLDKHRLQRALRIDHLVVDLVNLEKSRRPDGESGYKGLCW